MQGRSAKFITWTENFCTAYSDFALLAAKAFLYTALALAVLLVVLAAIKAFTAQPVVNPAAQAGGNAITGLIESLKGFVVSLSDAPTWLALFAGGVLLLWMAGNSVPEYCEPAEPSPNTRSGAGGSGAPQPPRPAT